MVTLKGWPGLKAFQSPTWLPSVAFSMDPTKDLAASRRHRPRNLDSAARLPLDPPLGHASSRSRPRGPAHAGPLPFEADCSSSRLPRPRPTCSSWFALAPPTALAPSPHQGARTHVGLPLALPKGRAPNPGHESPAGVRHADPFEGSGEITGRRRPRGMRRRDRFPSPGSGADGGSQARAAGKEGPRRRPRIFVSALPPPSQLMGRDTRSRSRSAGRRGRRQRSRSRSRSRSHGRRNRRRRDDEVRRRRRRQSRERRWGLRVNSAGEPGTHGLVREGFLEKGTSSTSRSSSGSEGKARGVPGRAPGGRREHTERSGRGEAPRGRGD